MVFLIEQSPLAFSKDYRIQLPAWNIPVSTTAAWNMERRLNRLMTAAGGIFQRHGLKSNDL
jgi:hypothetical protein